MNVYYLLVSALCFWTRPTNSQFFYSSHVAPVFPPAFYHPVIHQPTLAGVAAPIPYNLPLAQNRIPSTSTLSVRYNLPPVQQQNEYRGFGYRTDYTDGATSTVYFVTGPESTQLRSFKDFPNFNVNIEKSTPENARNLASNIIDVNAVPDANGRINNILRRPEFEKLFVNNHLPGVINFYTFPAGTAPLTRQAVNVSEEAATTTTSSPPTTTSEETEAAESVVNARILENNIENSDKLNQTQEISSTTELAKETEQPSSTNANIANETTESTETTTAAVSEVASDDVKENNNPTTEPVTISTTESTTTASEEHTESS